MIYYHATPAENLEAILADGLKPAIGPRSQQIGEETPAIYAFDDEAMLEDALGGWLGDCFDEEGVMKIAMLAIDLTDHPQVFFQPDGLSHVCDTPIPAAAVRLMRIEAF